MITGAIDRGFCSPSSIVRIASPTSWILVKVITGGIIISIYRFFLQVVLGFDEFTDGSLPFKTAEACPFSSKRRYLYVIVVR